MCVVLVVCVCVCDIGEYGVAVAGIGAVADPVAV